MLVNWIQEMINYHKCTHSKTMYPATSKKMIATGPACFSSPIGYPIHFPRWDKIQPVQIDGLRLEPCRTPRDSKILKIARLVTFQHFVQNKELVSFVHQKCRHLKPP